MFMVREYGGQFTRQHTCPQCGTTGAGTPLPPLPLCHSKRCNFKVKMLPSHNGEILDDWDCRLVEESIYVLRRQEEIKRAAADRARDRKASQGGRTGDRAVRSRKRKP